MESDVSHLQVCNQKCSKSCVGAEHLDICRYHQDAATQGA